MGIIIFIVVVFALVLSALSSIYVVRQQSVAIIERFWSLSKDKFKWYELRLPFGIDKIAARVQLRLLQSEIVVETKTQDKSLLR